MRRFVELQPLFFIFFCLDFISIDRVACLIFCSPTVYYFSRKFNIFILLRLLSPVWFLVRFYHFYLPTLLKENMESFCVQMLA